MSIEYYTRKFTRHKKSPLSQEEYEVIDKYFENFIQTEFVQDKLKYKEFIQSKYHSKVLIIAFAIVIILIFSSIFIDTNFYPVPEWIDIILFFLGLGILIRILGYLRTKMEIADYYSKFRSYYKYHKKLVMQTNSYEEYRAELKRRASNWF